MHDISIRKMLCVLNLPYAICFVMFRNMGLVSKKVG